MFYIDDRYVTHSEVQIRVDQLTQLGHVQQWPGKRLAVCTSDVFEWLCLVLYGRASGAAIAPVHPDTPKETALTKAAQSHCSQLLWQSADNFQPVPPELLPTPARTRADALLQFSSGTTGAPKLVERPWGEISREIESYNRRLQVDGSVTPVIACPVTHSYGLICGFLASLARGVEPRIITGLNPKYLYTVLLRHDQPLLYSSPQFLHSLMQLLPPAYTVHGVMTSGTLMPRHWFDTIKSRSRLFYQQYGCSEAGCIAISKDPQSADVMGMPLDHLTLAAGESHERPGEIVVQAYGREISTSDLGYLDTDGQLHFCSRLDDTIVVAGQNVYPAEVEDALLAHPAITDAAVLRLQNDATGDRAVAIYSSEQALSSRDLRHWCNQRLARYQWPADFRRVEHIARMPNGKLNRRQLLDTYLQSTPKSEVV